MSRFRVFAGPNGSGKSTVIKTVRDNFINFGVYVNADDIAVMLSKGRFSFTNYGLKNITADLFDQVISKSGLINDNFSSEEFLQSYQIINNELHITAEKYKERIAQITANFMIKQLLAEKAKCSIETVFSHRSKVDIMRIAAEKGYKVYLYFVATNDPEINITRVASRVKDGGHDVPKDRIIARYYRSLGMLYEAAQLAYQAYFFDNSGNEHRLIAHFKMENNKRNWDEVNKADLPNWFKEYYINKQPD